MLKEVINSKYLSMFYGRILVNINMYKSFKLNIILLFKLEMLITIVYNL